MAVTYRYIPFALLNLYSYEEMEVHIQEIINTFGPNNINSNNLLAFLVSGPFPLTQSIGDMNTVVNIACDLAEKYNIAVYFSVDDVTNIKLNELLPNTAETKYSDDPTMIEWSNWAGYEPGQWFNWGRWLVTGNVPCFASPNFKNFMTSRLQNGVLTPLITRLSQWSSKGKLHLFAGISPAWETHIQDWTPGGIFIAPDANNPPVNYPWPNLIDAPISTARASSYASASWTPDAAIDRNYGSAWSSQLHAGMNYAEWLDVDMGAVYSNLYQVRLTAKGIHFPVDFKLQSSLDGTAFTDIPGQVYTNYPQPAANSVETFLFVTGMLEARYIRLAATKLSSDGSGNYYAQIVEFNVGIAAGRNFTNRSTVTVSSYLNSTWAASNAIDGNKATGWSSAAHGGQGYTEWITLDMGAVCENVCGARLTPRGECFPIDFKWQYSADGTTYADVPYQNYTGYYQPAPNAVQYFSFAQYVKARYLKLIATKLSADSLSNYCLQIMEMRAETATLYVPNPRSATRASSNLNGSWTSSNVIDGSNNTGWSSAAHASESFTEWIDLDLGSVCSNIGRVRLTAREVCFPVDFKFQSSSDGTTFTDIECDDVTLTNYVQPAMNSIERFEFISPVTARYIRLLATKLSKDSLYNYCCQIMEFRADSEVGFNTAIYATTQASSYLNASWVPSNASDLNNNTGWSSASHASGVFTEWINLDLGDIYADVGRVVLIPREVCFPVDFKLQISSDGTTFTDIPGQSYTNYAQPTVNAPQYFTFSKEARGRYIRLYATKLRPDSLNNWCCQIMEFKAERGRVMQAQEFAQSGYHSLSYLGYTETSFNAEALSLGKTIQQYTKEKLWQVQHDYTQLLAKTCYDAGIPRNNIFTHLVGWDSYQSLNSTVFPPIWTAVNAYSVPGFTMNHVMVPYDMASLKSKIKAVDSTQPYFNVSEGYCPGLDTEENTDKYLYEIFDNGALTNTVFAYCYEPPTSSYFVPKDPAHPFNRSVKKWLNYNAVERSSVTASSYLNRTWAVANAINYDTATGWSSAAHAGESYTEWLLLDMGVVNNNIGRIRITSRECCFPVDFKFQYSNDGTTFTDVPGQSYAGYPQPNLYDVQCFPFDTPVNARYIRLYATRLRPDSLNNWCCQLMEFNADIELGYTALSRNAVSASSFLNGSWVAANAVDDNYDTGWSSAAHSSGAYTEWITLDVGAVKNKIGRVKLTSRECCFPVDFKFQYSTDGTNYYDVPGQSYTNYAQPPRHLVKTFEFVSPVKARYIRLYATKLRPDSLNNWCCQIMELRAYSIAPKYPVRASSYLSTDWLPENAADSDLTTGWSSAAHTGATYTEWLDIDLQKTYTVSNVYLTSKDYCFPVDFKLQYSTNGTTFTDVPGQSYTNYAQPSVYSKQAFVFGTSVSARFIRLTATKLRPDNLGVYYAQILEFEAN